MSVFRRSQKKSISKKIRISHLHVVIRKLETDDPNPFVAANESIYVDGTNKELIVKGLTTLF
jgi:hypothetical protein